MDSATRGGVLGYGGFALIGAAARAVQARAMSTSRSRQRLGDLSNDATVDKGLGLIDRGACRIQGGGAALGAAVAIGQGLSQVGALAAGSGARLVRVNLLPRVARTRPRFPGRNASNAPHGFEWRGKPGSLAGSREGN